MYKLSDDQTTILDSDGNTVRRYHHAALAIDRYTRLMRPFNQMVHGVEKLRRTIGDAFAPAVSGLSRGLDDLCRNLEDAPND